jgi:hypothetical protein
VELFKESNFDGALAEFRRAQQIAPNWRVEYNLGQTYYEMQRFAEALKAFEAYLRDGGAAVPKERRAAVEADIERLRGRVATLDIAVDAEGAEVTVDGEPVELTGSGPYRVSLLVSSGRRKVSATAPGRVPSTKVVEVVGGDHASLSMELAEVVVATAPATFEPSDTSLRGDATSRPAERAPTVDEPPSKTPIWIAWGATGVLAAGAVTTGFLALSANKTLDARLAEYPADPRAVADARDKARTMALVSDVFIASAVVGAGVAGYLTWRSVSSKSARASTSPRVAVGVGIGSVSASGTF